MKRVDWGFGIFAGLVIGVIGLFLRPWLAFGLEGLSNQVNYALGTPAMFNFVHKIFGYGELAKNLAFVGAAVAWLFIHPFLMLAWRKNRWAGLAITFGFYFVIVKIYPKAWLSALVYTAIFALFWWMFFGRTRGEVASQKDRREAIKTIALMGVVATTWSHVVAQSKITFQKITGLWPELISQEKLYVVSKNISALDPNLTGKPYALEIAGLVNKPQSFTLEQLKSLSAKSLINTMTCISNPVGGNLIGTMTWRGVPFKTVLELVSPKGTAKHIVWEAADGFRETIPLAEVPAEAMLCFEVKNEETGKFEELSPKHGYPVRILLPGRYGMKQPKWLTKITFSDKTIDGYWAQRGWSKTAKINTMSRIDVPANNTGVKLGKAMTVAGIAYAGGRALERIELSFDEGKTWRTAELRPPKAKYALQQWAYTWLPAPGEDTVQVRAVEVGGKVQSAALHDPLPEGSSGYHRVGVSPSS